jgi:hypothetical protein
MTDKEETNHISDARLIEMIAHSERCKCEKCSKRSQEIRQILEHRQEKATTKMNGQ